MVRHTACIAAIAIAVVIASQHAADVARAADTPNPVAASLVADAAAIEPGGSFTVGVLLKLKPHWHTYWLNPGDSGKATDVAFEAPEGFTIGELRWPTPGKFTQVGGFVGYGYEHEVLLSAKMTAPATIKPGQTFTIKATASWMVCDDRSCLEGAAKPTLTLKVAEHAEAANAELFEGWASRQPEPASAAEGVFEPVATSGGAAIAVKWAKPVTDVDWYPAVGPDLLIEKVAADTRAATTTIRYTAQRLGGEATHVPGLLVFTDAAGRRRAIRLDGPVVTK